MTVIWTAVSGVLSSGAAKESARPIRASRRRMIVQAAAPAPAAPAAKPRQNAAPEFTA